MGAAFYSMEDVRLYLHGTVCTWKGVPVNVVVQSGLPDNHVSVIHVGSTKTEVVDYTSDDFDYRSVSLGYMDTGEHAAYVERFPCRKTKQGLHNENMYGRTVGGQQICLDNWVLHPAFRDCILGSHVSAHAADKLIKSFKKVSVPIARHIAVGRIDNTTMGLWYRNNLVGKKKWDESSYLLQSGEETSFLRRALERHVCLL